MSDIEVWRPNQFKLVNELRLPPEKETNAKKMKNRLPQRNRPRLSFYRPDLGGR